ncbi:DNA-3-methyladenine glycosylase [Actinomyces sp. B33]|uniref:DNA-3-methyladenine glycosylase n=1 Tax=Actinomyces sp. B33 TaxID=2942131 RepID=UPI0023415240|nr:DNA-3-methyladenine glycosylase [Actinomyces sp. B33]MDC4232214.1 DNA-3-methyladenine glycosylase [Actinomyces sp. B33]
MDPIDLLADDAVDVAPLLLGAVLAVRDPRAPDAQTVAVRLTEVEAYGGAEDPGSHAYTGRTPRNASMFEAGGILYVYFTYGMHHCANIVCGPAGRASAVLLRAGEVVAGGETARSRRPAARRDADLARGPGRLCAALGLTRADDGARLGRAGSRASLVLPDEPVPPGLVRTGPRTGVSGLGGDGTAFPRRFWIDSDPTVSPYRPARRRRG